MISAKEAKKLKEKEGSIYRSKVTTSALNHIEEQIKKACKLNRSYVYYHLFDESIDVDAVEKSLEEYGYTVEIAEFGNSLNSLIIRW